MQGQGPEWGLAMQSRGPLWSCCGVSGIEGRVRDLLQAPPGAGGDSRALQLRFAWEGLFVGRGTTRNLGSVSTPRRGGSYRPGRGCDSRRRPQPVSAREVRVLGSGPDLRRGLWALGVGPRLRASVLGSDLEI